MTESRTGLVHTTLGHGQEDFLTSMKYNLLLIFTVDDNDNFIKEIGQFSSLDVLGDGNVAIVKSLDEHFTNNIIHKTLVFAWPSWIYQTNGSN